MNHSELDELYELYVLHLLDAGAASTIREHLEANCDFCTARILEAEKLTAALSSLVVRVNPPAEVRDRVLRIAGGRNASPKRWSWAFAAAAVFAVLVFGWGFQQLGKNRAMESEIADLLRERNALRSAVAILSQSDMKTVKFGANQSAAHGRVFVSNSGGVVFVGSQLPELISNSVFELWLIPAKGKPQSAGIFKTNASGVAVRVLPQRVDTASIAAIAVSVEPNGGSPQPTTKPILVIPLA